MIHAVANLGIKIHAVASSELMTHAVANSEVMTHAVEWHLEGRRWLMANWSETKSQHTRIYNTLLRGFYEILYLEFLENFIHFHCSRISLEISEIFVLVSDGLFSLPECVTSNSATLYSTHSATPRMNSLCSYEDYEKHLAVNAEQQMACLLAEVVGYLYSTSVWEVRVG